MKHLTKILMAWLLWPLLSAAVLSSCSMMHEDRDDCPTGLYLSFRYNYNLERADMFGDHVGAVDVYVFDADGHYVTTLADANRGPPFTPTSPRASTSSSCWPGKTTTTPSWHGAATISFAVSLHPATPCRRSA